jgi:hypothetical protein
MCEVYFSSTAEIFLIEYTWFVTPNFAHKPAETIF